MYLQKVNMQKNNFLLTSSRSMTKIAGSGSGARYGSIGQRHESTNLLIRIRNCTKMPRICNTAAKAVNPGPNYQLIAIL
jgi:hypothetical protein